MPNVKRMVQRARRNQYGTKPFEVMVAATVSAGKSSLINALLGQELLHTANEATTACVTRLEHGVERKAFMAECHDRNGTAIARRRSLSAEMLREWNADSRVASISLKGNFRGASLPSSGLVIYDTPGPNNSQNKGHGQKTRAALNTISANALLYVLNAGYLGTQDDRMFLDSLLKKPAAGRSTIFILNKVDLLDPERGEDIGDYVGKAQRYLVDAGFPDPMVVPTIADAALHARQAMNRAELSRSQRSRMTRTLAEFDDRKHELIETALVPERIRQRLRKELDMLEANRAASAPGSWQYEKNQLQQLVVLSGVRTVEAVLQHARSMSRK